MSDETSFNRRKFLQSAAWTGAAALAAPPVFGQSTGPAGEPVTSLIRPTVPLPPGATPLAPPDKQSAELKLPEPKKKLGWAVVGLGKLAVEEIVPAFGSCKSSRLAAFVSGHPDKARQLAEVYGIPNNPIYNYANFNSIRDNPGIDVVYIVLPNSMHAEFTIRALEAGKHVLCEKPMAVSVAECEAMIAAAKKANRTLAVAYRLHYEPTNKAVMDMCREKKFGPIKTFAASNCATASAPNIRLTGALGGGPLGDLGVYCINAARYTIGEEPIEAMAVSVQPKSDPRFLEVPASVSFILRYASGVTAECECSFDSNRVSRYQVICEKGSIVMDPAYMYFGLKLTTEEDATSTHIGVKPVNQFASEMDGVSECIMNGQPVPTPGEMGLADMRVIIAVLESARLGGAPVKVGGVA